MMSLFEVPVAAADGVSSLLDGLGGSGLGRREVRSLVDLLDVRAGAVQLLDFAALDAADAEPGAGAVEVPADTEAATAAEAAERARQVRVMVDAAREEAERETRARVEAECAGQVAAAEARVRELMAELARDREVYFLAAEAQAVRLALSVARKVLLREAAVDPVLLAGSVRAALSKVQDGSVSRLFVARGEAEAWREVLAGTELRVAVEGSSGMQVGELRLETSVGEVELGIRAQLEEIESGFGEFMRGAERE